MVNVLVVDDSAFMRQLIKDILSADGEIKVVGEADDGEEAVKLYKELEPDIITLDIVMEGANGISALEQIIKINPNAIIIMITSVGQEKYLRECLEKGAKGFVIKPFDEEDVRKTVKKAAVLIEK